jgi:hypothetical protein
VYTQEFQEKYSGRYFGKYRALVTDSRGDPKKLGRIKTKVPVIMGEEELGWALPNPPKGGGFDTGQLSLPLRNDYVWIEFEEGDPSRPIWTHGPWGIRAGKSMVPRHSQGKPDSTDYARREYGNIPPTQYNGEYGYVEYMGTKDGSFLEFDNTPGAGRVQLSHFTGTRIEMTSDGSLQEIATQSARKHVGENQNVQVVGREDYSVGNDRKISVGGNLTHEITGNFFQSYFDRTEVGQTLNRALAGNQNIEIGGSWTQRCLSQAYINVGGQLGFQCAQNIQMSASEYIELIGMNSNFTAQDAAILQGYNGDTVVHGTMVDPIAGVHISQAALQLAPSVVPTATFAKLSAQIGPADTDVGSIKVTAEPVKNILLGGDLVTNQLLYGTAFNTAMIAYMTGMTAFIAAIVADPLLKVLAPATSAAAVAFQPIVASALGQFSSQAFLSPFAWTR